MWWLTERSGFVTYSRFKDSFFFSGAPGHGPSSAMVSAMARRHQYLTEPECNGSAEQRLKEGTPVRQNRPGIEPGPPETKQCIYSR